MKFKKMVFSFLFILTFLYGCNNEIKMEEIHNNSFSDVTTNEVIVNIDLEKEKERINEIAVESKKKNNPSLFFLGILDSDIVTLSDFDYHIINSKVVGNFIIKEIAKGEEEDIFKDSLLTVDFIESEIAKLNTKINLKNEKEIEIYILRKVFPNKSGEAFGNRFFLYERPESNFEEVYSRTFLHEMGHVLQENFLEKARYFEYENFRLVNEKFYNKKIDTVFMNGEKYNFTFEYEYSPYEFFANDFSYAFSDDELKHWKDDSVINPMNNREILIFKNMIKNNLKGGQ